MWIKSSGALTENVFQLTTAASSHLLIIGDAAALVDSGISATIPRLFEELGTYLGPTGALSFLLITHAHFDHVGGIPYLRKAYPDMEVIGSPQISDLLGQKSYVEQLYQRNLAYAEAMQTDMGMSEEEWCELVRVTHILGDGDAIDLGDDVEVKLISCPGHTEDSVAYFVQPDAALSGGEAVGYYGGREKIVNCFTNSYEDYMDSLGRLSGLDVRVLGFPHVGALTGELVTKYFMEAKQEAESFKHNIIERLGQGEIIDEIALSILPDWQAQNYCPEGPFLEEQEATLKAMVRAVATSA